MVANQEMNILSRSVQCTLLAGTVAGLLAVAVPAVPASGAPSPGSAARAYVVQGVPGVSVDVSLDGKPVQTSMGARDIAGPFNLARGTHMVTFEASKWTVGSSFDVNGKSLDIVLHWGAAQAKPQLTVFRNDVAPVPSGKGRLAVANTAVVPPADIRVQGKVLFSNIANGEFVTAVVPAMTYSVAVVPTGGGAPLVGPVDLAVKAGALTRMFAIGMPTNGSMNTVVQVLPVPELPMPPPGSVNAGSAGLLSPPERGGSASWADAAPLVALTALLVGAVALLGRRGRR